MSWAKSFKIKVKHPDPCIHVHEFSTYTSVCRNHVHLMDDITQSACGSLCDCHQHCYEGTTSVSDDHFHYYRGITSTPVALTGGGHGHWFRGTTSIRDGHMHHYRWFTGPQLLTKK